MPDEIFGVMAVKNGQKQTIMNLSNARQKSYADLQNMTDAQKKGVIICPDYPKGAFLVQADQVGYGDGSVADALDLALDPAPSSMTNIDLSAYTIASGNKYVFPSDGYIWVSVPNGTTPATVRIYAKDGASFTFVQTSYPNIFLFPVYKGMMTAASDFSVFRFVQFSH